MRKSAHLLSIAMITSFMLASCSKHEKPKAEDPGKDPATIIKKETSETGKPPVIASIAVTSESETEANIAPAIQDEDSTTVDVYVISFEKDKAPKQEEIDWTKAAKIAKADQTKITGLEKDKMYIVFVKAVDDKNNTVISSQEFMNGKAVVSEKKPGEADGKGKIVVTKEMMTAVNQAIIDNLQIFLDDLCEAYPASEDQTPDVKESIEEICKTEFTQTNPHASSGLDIFITSTFIDLDMWGITEIPESIGNILTLVSLDASQNKLKELPESFGHLENLTNLEIYSNQFEELPSAIANLKHLLVLDISNNAITEIPEWIGNLQELQELDLSSNKLAAFPESIGKLQNLEYLTLNSNQLKEIPEWVGTLKNLKELYVANTQITTIPDSVVALPKLEFLNVRGNTFTADVIKKIKDKLGDKVEIDEPKSE